MSFIIDDDKWLSGILSRPVLKVSFDPSSDSKDPLNSLSIHPSFFAYGKVSPSELGGIKALEKAGFNLVDTNVSFSKPRMPMMGKNTSPLTFRFARPEDEARSVALATEAFSTSRFHLDPNFSAAEANKIKGEWVRNYFRGQRGESFIVCENGEAIVGFLQLIRPSPSIMVIDLIAVAPNSRRMGIGRSLIQFAEESIHDFKELRVGTQLANTASLRMYEEIGFRFEAAQYIFHLHK